MRGFIAFAVALAALASICLADVGPGPTDIPGITLHATIDGSPIPDGTTAKLHCYFGNGTEFMGPTGTWGCEGGTCTGGMYKLNPCASSGNATFEFSNPSFSQNYTTSPPVLVERGNDYSFNVSISSSSGTAAISGQGNPQPLKACAGILLVLFGLAAVPLAIALRH